MRKIKFRMWNPLGRDGRGRYHYGKQAMECLTQQSIGLYDHEKEGCIFEQFTGLHDKNGKESYYNDIVRNVEINGTYCDCMIKEIKGCFVFRQMGAEYFSIPMFEVKSSMWEVIGNIHENPEHI